MILKESIEGRNLRREAIAWNRQRKNYPHKTPISRVLTLMDIYQAAVENNEELPLGELGYRSDLTYTTVKNLLDRFNLPSLCRTRERGKIPKSRMKYVTNAFSLSIPSRDIAFFIKIREDLVEEKFSDIELEENKHRPKIPGEIEAFSSWEFMNYRLASKIYLANRKQEHPKLKKIGAAKVRYALSQRDFIEPQIKSFLSQIYDI